MIYIEHGTEFYDMSRIAKLNKLTNIETFWKDVKKLTRNVRSDFAMERWQCLAEIRYKELEEGIDISPVQEEPKDICQLLKEYKEADMHSLMLWKNDFVEEKDWEAICIALNVPTTTVEIELKARVCVAKSHYTHSVTEE